MYFEIINYICIKLRIDFQIIKIGNERRGRFKNLKKEYGNNKAFADFLLLQTGSGLREMVDK